MAPQPILEQFLNTDPREMALEVAGGSQVSP